jgi:hypothetical protein
LAQITLDAANRWLVAVKRQLQTGEPPSVIGKAIEKVVGGSKFAALSFRDMRGSLALCLWCRQKFV